MVMSGVFCLPGRGNVRPVLKGNQSLGDHNGQVGLTVLPVKPVCGM